MTYANAGHSPPIILKDCGKVLRLSGGGAVLGVFSEESYDLAQLALEPGDVFLAYIDGVSEAQNSAGEEYGEERLIA
jgi:sigma-B regulation protein RsbU (phosphoserine phosphatase)